MADQRYVVDLILNARDNTAAAFAKAAGQMEAFKRLSKEAEEQNKRTGESFAQMSQRINTSQAEMNRQMSSLNLKSGEAVQHAAALEKANAAYVKTLNDANASSIQRANALRAVRAAEDDLGQLGGDGGRQGPDGVVEAARQDRGVARRHQHDHGLADRAA